MSFGKSSRKPALKRLRRQAIGVVTIALSAAALVGCSSSLGGNSGDSGDSAGRTIKIGYVSPETGPLAAFGEADKFVIDQMTDYYKKNGITMGDGKHDVEIIAKDTQSDAKRAADVASDLILKDNVDQFYDTNGQVLTDIFK